jgi:hypothetical protein
MSTKFEQLLDLIVNEEMEKANELFHEIVVEKSRNIYENLIAEEAEEDEQQDESVEDEEEQQDESVEDEEQQDESMDLEDSYSMEADDEDDGFGGDPTDNLGSELEVGDEEEMDGEEDSEDQAIFDIKSAIEQLEAAFADLEAAQAGEEEMGDFGDEEEPSDEFGDETGADEMMGFQEGRRVTREYVEKVGNDWEKSGSMKGQGQSVAAGTGDKEGAPQEGRSPISSGSGKPNTGANAKNILGQGATEAAPDGTSPKGKAGGLVKNAQTMNTGNQNVPGGKVSVKGLTNVKGGHGAEKKGAGPGPVGSGTGDKAGQTSVGKVPTFLKKL